MDPGKELDEERARRIRLEQELANWHNNAIDRLTPEQLAMAVQAQQVESLTYHLLRCRNEIDELKKRVASREKELSDAVNNIKYLEGKLDEKTQMLDKLIERERATVAQETAGQRFGAGTMPSDDDLDRIIDDSIRPRREEPPRTVRDLVQIMRRMERIKLLDASILLDVDPHIISKWANQLASKGYIVVQGTDDNRVLVARDKLRGGR